MKHLSVFLFLLSFSMAKAQNIKPFPSRNATWTFEQRVDPNGDLAGTINYQLGGDTLLDNKSYDKLISDTSYLGAIRYIDNRLYFYPPDSTRELLLFDFNAKAGDTIFHAFDGYKFWNIPVLSVDSTYVNGELRRVWQTHCESWIEGIGGTWVWLYPRTQTLCFFQTIHLKCFSSDITKYGNCENGNKPKFISERNRWHVAACGVDFNTGNYDCGLGRYIFQDSIIWDNFLYHKLYRSFPADYDNLTFAGNIYREDAQGNVFIRDSIYNGYSKEYQIYRFDVNIGETVKIGTADEYHFDLTVIAIDSIRLLSGEKRKRIKLIYPEINQKVFWIEGIGSNYAPMDTRLMFITDGALELACYEYNGEIEYETEKCDLRTSTDETTSLSFAKFFPNPFTSELNIQTEITRVYELQLFDAVGKLMLQQNNIGGDFHLNTAAFPAGVYYLRLQDTTGNFQTEKLVKMKG